jgi:hypothetical protein
MADLARFGDYLLGRFRPANLFLRSTSHGLLQVLYFTESEGVTSNAVPQMQHVVSMRLRLAALAQPWPQ